MISEMSNSGRARQQYEESPWVTASQKGFTLVELLIALGLSGLLLTGIFSAVRLNGMTRDAGQAILDETSAAHGLFQDLQSDFRQIVPHLVFAPESSAAENEKANKNEVFDNRLRSSTIGVVPIQAVEPLFFYGSSKTLMFQIPQHSDRHHLRLPLPETNSDATGSPSEVSPFTRSYSVIYTLGSGSTIQIPAESIGIKTGQSSIKYLCKKRGLLRMEREAYSPLKAGSLPGSDLTAQIETLAPDAIDVSFLYFDGMKWHAEWNSRFRGDIPVAIELKTTFVHPTRSTKYRFYIPASQKKRYAPR